MAARRAVPVLLMALASSLWSVPAARPSPALPTAGSCRPTWQQVPSANPGSSGSLYGVAGMDGHDLWSVGQQVDDIGLTTTLAEHWDGSVWTVVPTPTGEKGLGLLRSVTAISSTDVWAVGLTFNPMNVDDQATLTLHWDGAAWTELPSPHPGVMSELLGVWGDKHNEVWAVGSYSAHQETHILIERWNGSAWSLVPTPGLASFDLLRSVSGASSDDVWAVGQTEAETLALHWDGAAWTQVATPTPGVFNEGLYDVTAITSTDVWAVGYSESQNATKFWSRWHWDGVAWTTEPDDPLITDIYPAAVAALSWGDVWSVGNWGTDYPAADHWDGATWSRVAGPVVQSGYLLDSAAVDGTLWTVGWASDGQRGVTYTARVCPVSVADGGFFPSSSRLSMGGRAFWAVAPGSTQDHSITDGSGMGLFDSGLRAPGASFDFQFDVGGTYTIADAGSSNISSLSIPITISPKQGGLTTTFHVLWATYYAQPGYIYDVQIKRPGAPDFVDWKVNQIPDEADFVPDTGTGTYSFRARLRSTRNGAFSGWSPPASITVT